MRRLQRRTKLTPAEKARQIRLMGDVARRITRDNHIVFIAGVTPKVVVINRATGKEKRLDLVQAAAVSETALTWRISLYALCRDERGNEYIKAECILLEQPVRQRDIHQSLNKHHMAFALHPESESGVIYYGEDELREMWEGCMGLEPVGFQEYRRAREEGWVVDWLPEWYLI